MLHTKNYSFVKLPLVTNDISNILKNKGLLFAEHEEHKVQRKLLLSDFSHARIRKLVPGFSSKGVEITEKVAEVVGSPERCRRCWWRWEVVLICDAGYDRLFRL